MAIDKIIQFSKPLLSVSERRVAQVAAPFALVYLWKIALLAFFALPPPANDSFFYDGAVVNYLLHGTYANPSLALALPISGTQVFSAYPPLYQLVLDGWMSAFGTSALSAMTFHLVLFGAYLALLGSVLHRLSVPAGAIRVAALFLFAITFHDRPDSLAHVFGFAAVYSWLRSRILTKKSADAALYAAESKPAEVDCGEEPSRLWAWGMAVCSVLALGTSLQIGATYWAVIWLLLVGDRFLYGRRLAWGPTILLALLPPSLLALVAFGFPHLWNGFLEHAHQTPSFTGWRLPRVDDLLKAFRTLPGLLAAAAILTFAFGSLARRAPTLSASRFRELFLVTSACAAAGLAVCGAALFLLTPNSVLFAQYLQALAVAGCLTLIGGTKLPTNKIRAAHWLFVALACLGAIRAIGLSTWGIACAVDVPYKTALASVRAELRDCRGKSVVLSSAYLYDAVHIRDVSAIHSDWMQPSERNQPLNDWKGLQALKPAKLILTQFDFFRRYQLLLTDLRQHPDIVGFSVQNMARVPAPDSFPQSRRVLQHISWAPVIITLNWKEASDAVKAPQ